MLSLIVPFEFKYEKIDMGGTDWMVSNLFCLFLLTNIMDDYTSYACGMNVAFLLQVNGLRAWETRSQNLCIELRDPNGNLLSTEEKESLRIHFLARITSMMQAINDQNTTLFMKFYFMLLSTELYRTHAFAIFLHEPNLHKKLDQLDEIQHILSENEYLQRCTLYKWMYDSQKKFFGVHPKV